MNETLWNAKWNCIVCNKSLPNEYLDMGDESGSPGAFPNIEGGTASIHFGYGSRNDQIRTMIRDIDEQYICCICDDCFDDKRCFIKRVEVINKKEYIIKE